jgi:hypothetical protein
MLVIDGKYNNKDGRKCAKDCRQVIDDKIRICIDGKTRTKSTQEELAQSQMQCVGVHQG